MSTKDTIKAAEMLLKTFGPVVEAIPAVISSLEKQDQAEKMLAQLSNDYNKLVDTYNKKLSDIEKADATMLQRMDARQAELNALEAVAKDALADLVKKNREAGAKLTAKQKEVAQAQTTTAQELAKVQAEYEAGVDAMRKSSAAKIAELEAATTDAQKKHDDIVKKLEALKAKL